MYLVSKGLYRSQQGDTKGARVGVFVIALLAGLIGLRHFLWFMMSCLGTRDWQEKDGNPLRMGKKMAWAARLLPIGGEVIYLSVAGYECWVSFWTNPWSRQRCHLDASDLGKPRRSYLASRGLGSVSSPRTTGLS